MSDYSNSAIENYIARRNRRRAVLRKKYPNRRFGRKVRY